MSSSKQMSDIPLIRNINAGKNRQPTQEEVVFLRQHLPTLEDGLADTRKRMTETKNRLEMAWIKLNAMRNEIPHHVFQSWLEQATSPLGDVPLSPESPKRTRSLKQAGRSKPQHSISYPSPGLTAKHVQFLGLISTLHVHQSTLHRYESNYALLNEELNLVKTLLHPLHGVPFEVLEKIWLYAVEGGEMERRKKSVERGDHPVPMAWPAPFALAAVCKDWRMLVRSEPRLWEYLVLDLRCPREKYQTFCPMIHERIQQHLEFSHNLPLDITIIAWGDHLRMDLAPMIRPLLRNGNVARTLDDDREGLGRVELVTGGSNDKDAGYTEILEALPPAQHLALVRVWPLHKQIRIPANFCAQLRRIEAYDAVFHIESSTGVTEGALFRMDRGPIHEFLQQNPSLEQLTIDGLRYTPSDSSLTAPIASMAQLHTLAFRITDLDTHLQRFHSTPIISLPSLRKLILLDMPDVLLSNDWKEFVSANGQKVKEVEVRSITAYAGRRGQPPEYLAHLRILPALSFLHLVGDCARHVLGAMVSQGGGVPVLGRVTRIHVRDSKLPKRALQAYGWSSLKPASPWTWQRVGAKAVQIGLERVQLGEIHPSERRFTN